MRYTLIERQQKKEEIVSLHNMDTKKHMEQNDDEKMAREQNCDTGKRMYKAEGGLTEAAYASWLDRIPSIGSVTAKRLLGEYGNAERLYRLSEKEVTALAERKLLTAAQAGKLREWQTDFRYEPHRLYEAMTAQGIRVICYNDAEYPKRLRNIPEPPNMLYVKGRVPEEGRPSVSIVGARLCSDYGRYTARKFAHVLAGAGIQVISGMALGIDGISHRAAMEAGGRTFAVLGCGVDICYPAQNQEIYEKLPSYGGILSEYPPGTAPCAGLFPRRNRIISGLADILLVIEARKKSGTLMTVEAALEQGKEVYALPGRVTDALSGGCNALIAQGAGIATSPDRLLEELSGIWKGSGLHAGSRTEEGIARRMGETEGRSAKMGERAGETEDTPERLVYALLTEEGQTFDMLMSLSTLAPGECSAALMRLCVEGFAICRQGRYYRSDAG